MRVRVAVLILLLIFATGCTIKAPKQELPAVVPEPGGEKAMQTRGTGFPEIQKAELMVETEAKAQIDRKIIKSAYIKLEVEDFDSAASEVEKLAYEAGGYISQSNSYVTPGNHRQGTITMRIPEGSFGSIIEELKKLGRVMSYSSSGRDVTEEYIDLNARLRNLQRQEERLLEILDRAETVKDVLEVERELGRVRGEIERLEGRLRYLDNRVEFATITVELREPEPITRSLGLRSAISDAVKGLVTVTRALIVAAGYLLPIAAMAAVLFAAVRRLRKRR
ncbi:DUF4349 domain-containing protein [Candidatus Pyrohabitans sp.]